MFGLLWVRSRRVSVPKGHIAPFPTVVKMASRRAMRIASRFIRLAACGPRSGLFVGLDNRGVLDVCLQQISLLAHLCCEAVLWEEP